MYRRLIGSYVTVISMFAMSLGGYVACGAQSYRVAVDNDTDGRRTTNLPAGTLPGTNLSGIHSSRGWEGRLPIRYRVGSDFSRPHLEQLQKAMKTWESAAGKTLFAFEGLDERKGKEFSSLYAPLDDAINGHYLDTTWEKSTGKPAAVLATTLWENDARDHQAIAKADIRYNLQHYFFGNSLTDISQGDRTVVDLESLALHELGHLLGLGHISAEEDRYSVMNPALFIGEGMITRRLSRSDIERVRSIYHGGDTTIAEKLEKADDYGN